MPESFETEQLTKTKTAQLDLKVEPPGQLATQSSLDEVLAFGRQVSSAIEQLPKNVSNFWSAYQSLIVFLAWLLATVIVLKIAIAVLSVVHDIPLLSPILELVGLGYTGWFSVRYLIGYSTRQEVLNKFKGIRQYIFGQ